MKIIIIDDERLALVQLESMIMQHYRDAVNELKCYQLVSEALEIVPSFKPDIVFLDIQMPEMSGMEAAECIQMLHPQAQIIFVTAYEQYAIKAFELDALDYLLKPVTQQRLDKTFIRIHLQLKEQVVKLPSVNQRTPKIYCFNKIRFQLNGSNQIYPKWRTAKAQELFAYLVHHRGEHVSKYKIINMFTPEIDKKRGMTQLYTVIYQIRRCLKELGFEANIENDSIQESYCLRLEDTRIDFVEWEQAIKNLDRDNSLYISELEQIVQDYEGNYMGEYDYFWADSERERLLQLWIKHANLLIAHYEQAKQWTKIISLVEKIFYYNPYEYDQVLPLLKAYIGLGQLDKMKHYYLKYERECRVELDLPLPDAVTSWYVNYGV